MGLIIKIMKISDCVNYKYEVSSPDAQNNSHNMLALEEPVKNFCGNNYINVDRLFLVVSPFLFLIFNGVYWLSYGTNLFWAMESPILV